MAILSKFITENTSVLDQIINYYGTMDYAYSFLSINPSYGLLDAIQAGSTIYYDSSVIKTSSTPITMSINSFNPNIISLGVNTDVLSEVSSLYGTLDYIFTFLALNPSYQVLDTIEAGTSINIDSTFVKNIVPRVINVVPNPTTFNIQGIYTQDLFDLIIRHYGTLENIGKFLTDNNDLVKSITENTENNTYKIIQDLSQNDVLYFNSLNSVFATAIPKLARSFDKSFNFSFN